MLPMVTILFQLLIPVAHPPVPVALQFPVPAVLQFQVPVAHLFLAPALLVHLRPVRYQLAQVVLELLL